MNKLNKMFTEVVKEYNIGELTSEPVKLTGGITNIVYKIDTNKSSYVLKILSKKDLELFNDSEYISEVAHNNGINALCAIKNNNQYITHILTYDVVLYPYYDGIVLKHSEIDNDKLKELAYSLAKLHKLEVKKELEDKYISYEKNNFLEYYNMTKDIDEECFKFFNENIDKLNKINDEVYEAYKKLPKKLSYVHKDFNRRNVLWKGNDFRIIDWETSCVSMSVIDFMYAAWFITDDFNLEKYKTFKEAYFEINDLSDYLEDAINAGIIEEINWLNYSLRRALCLISNNSEEIKLGKESIESSMGQIFDYWENKKNIFKI